MAIRDLGLHRPPSLASRARRVARAPTFVQLAGLAVAALVLLPVAYLAIRTFTGDGNAFDLIFRARTGLILLRSLLLVVIVTAGSVAVAVPIAWLTTRSDLPARRLCASLRSLGMTTSRTRCVLTRRKRKCWTACGLSLR